jgi:hypothetical protein
VDIKVKQGGNNVKAFRAFQQLIQNSLFKKKTFYIPVMKRTREIQERKHFIKW